MDDVTAITTGAEALAAAGTVTILLVIVGALWIRLTRIQDRFNNHLIDQAKTASDDYRNMVIQQQTYVPSGAYNPVQNQFPAQGEFGGD